MYAHVSKAGTVTFRFDYRLNGRREPLLLGSYGRSGISLGIAREKLIDAKRAVSDGRSPAQEKQRQKRRLKEAKSFGQFGKRWIDEARMADSTRAMRRAIFDRDVLPAFKNRLLTEVKSEDIRQLCAKVKGRGTPATVIHVCDIIKQVFTYAILHGEKVKNPADEVGPASIATFEPRGPNVFKGYWQMPEKTAAELRSDRFFITGDLGRVDKDRYVHIVGRNKDLIISGGYNIYPQEIELLFDQQPGVLESAVIGVPHSSFGETVLGVIVPGNGQSPNLDAMMEAVKTSLARFKHPRELIVVDALPRNTMGKVQKNLLHEQYQTMFASP